MAFDILQGALITWYQNKRIQKVVTSTLLAWLVISLFTLWNHIANFAVGELSQHSTKTQKPLNKTQFLFEEASLSVVKVSPHRQSTSCSSASLLITFTDNIHGCRHRVLENSACTFSAHKNSTDSAVGYNLSMQRCTLASQHQNSTCNSKPAVKYVMWLLTYWVGVQGMFL